MSANNNVMSLYIPKVFPNFDKEYVAKAFKPVGVVTSIDFVLKQDRDGKAYNAVYVHFSEWRNSAFALNFLDDVMGRSDYEARLYHDGPWYWIVLPNTAKKHVPGERKPKIDLGDAKAISTKNADVTPVKKQATKVCPAAPQKMQTYAQALGFEAPEPKNLTQEFDDIDIDASEMEAEMAEIEALMDEEEANLVTIDGRYVQAMEQENWAMRADLQQLRAAIINLDQMYQAEAAKVRALSVKEKSM